MRPEWNSLSLSPFNDILQFSVFPFVQNIVYTVLGIFSHCHWHSEWRSKVGVSLSWVDPSLRKKARFWLV